MASLAEPPEVIEVGSTVAVAPEGSPDTLSVTDCGSPAATVVSTEPETVPPRTTLATEGVAAIVKSLGVLVTCVVGDTDGVGDGSGGGVLSTYSSSLGVPSGTPDSAFAVAAFMILSVIWAGVSDGLALKISAASPTTCGVAIEVPFWLTSCESLVFQADVIAVPGAKMSTHEPTLENDDRRSYWLLEPTVIACGRRAGERVQASAPLSLPAATP